MKKLISLYSIFVLLGIANGQWNTLNEWIDWQPKFDFVNEDMGWVAGENTILKTEDGGNTWFSLDSEGFRDITGIDFISENVGWAITYNGKILKTTDAGETWRFQKETDWGLRSLYAVNDSTVYVCGDSALVLKTTDGGEQWQDISRIASYYMLVEIVFINATCGVMWGYHYNPQTGYSSTRMFRTNNAGHSWEYLPQYNHSFQGNLQFVNDSKGYIIAGSAEHTKYILETQDTCSSWSVVKSFYLGNISAIKFFPNGTAYMILKENPDQSNFSLKKSTDNGVSWETCLQFDDVSVRDIYFINDQTGFAVAGSWADGALYKTNDGADGWSLKSISYPFKDVFFLDQDKGFVAGGYGGFHGARYGELWLTEDGGISWSKNPTKPEGSLTKCSFVSPLTGFAISSVSGREYSSVHRTTDGGMSWKPISINYPDTSRYYHISINDFCFTDNNTGWAAGHFWKNDTSGAVIIETVDGGDNWDIAWQNLNPVFDYSYQLKSIHCSETNIWAVGEMGLIVKYSEQDQWQKIDPITDLPLNTIFFSDQQHGWISGGYFDRGNLFLKLFKTINGGISWEEIDNFNYQINDIFFEDSLRGWVAVNDTSYKGMLLATADGGITWYKQTKDFAGALNALYFSGNYGWAVGEYGLVLKTEDKGINWVDQNTGHEYPPKYELLQNYPNPFNPTTTIEYSVRAHGNVPQHITLSIYNLLGQKVATLVDKKQTAGEYQVVWDASGFASGVYLYRLRAGDPSRHGSQAAGSGQSFIKTKKLIVIK